MRQTNPKVANFVPRPGGGMTMHTMWKGSLSFGLVNVPVKMFAATESKDIPFRYLHKTCQTPIQYTRTCPTCDKPVPWEEIVRGFEYEPNRFVVFSEEEMKALKKERAQTIDIVEFVQLSEIDPIYYDKTYYLAPESTGRKAYQLLEEAMRQTDKIAIAKTVIRSKETLACVRVGQGALVMETLFWPDEVRSTQELPNIHGNDAPQQNELDMAITLINQLATEFDASKYVDTGREETLVAIQNKIEQNEVTVSAAPAPAASNIIDLMQALQESIRMTQPAATETKPARKPRATTRKTTKKSS